MNVPWKRSFWTQTESQIRYSSYVWWFTVSPIIKNVFNHKTIKLSKSKLSSVSIIKLGRLVKITISLSNFLEWKTIWVLKARNIGELWILGLGKSARDEEYLYLREHRIRIYSKDLPLWFLQVWSPSLFFASG